VDKAVLENVSKIINVSRLRIHSCIMWRKGNVFASSHSSTKSTISPFLNSNHSADDGATSTCLQATLTACNFVLSAHNDNTDR
jgi:hypothetical protein